jgi:hypothetical protein
MDLEFSTSFLSFGDISLNQVKVQVKASSLCWDKGEEEV